VVQRLVVNPTEHGSASNAMGSLGIYLRYFPGPGSCPLCHPPNLVSDLPIPRPRSTGQAARTHCYYHAPNQHSTFEYRPVSPPHAERSPQPAIANVHVPRPP